MPPRLLYRYQAEHPSFATVVSEQCLTRRTTISKLQVIAASWPRDMFATSQRYKDTDGDGRDSHMRSVMCHDY